jgi:thiamine-monophosphate kinase
MTKLDEKTILRRIIRSFSGIVLPRTTPQIRAGIGDDAALLSFKSAGDLALSTDWFLEGVHFLRKLHSPESVGYKALARAVSDLAAMGARPHSFLLALALPDTHTGKWLSRFLIGLRRAAETFRVRLIGGDTTRNSSIVAQITVMGILPSGGAVMRSGAKPGDFIFVTGQLGAAELGLRILPYWPGTPLTRPSLRHPLLSAQMFPRPPVEFAQRVARRSLVTAMMDLSDGLSTDIARLCEAGCVGARIDLSRLPIVRIPRIPCAKKENAVELAFHGGDDYGLLFTMPKSRMRELKTLQRGERVTCIGEITRERKIVTMDSQGRIHPLISEGWDPFRRTRLKR